MIDYRASAFFGRGEACVILTVALCVECAYYGRLQRSSVIGRFGKIENDRETAGSIFDCPGCMYGEGFVHCSEVGVQSGLFFCGSFDDPS